MPDIQVKICGINSMTAADAVLQAGADYGGLVFFERSPRHLALEAGAKLAAHMRGRLKLAALVVDAGDDELAAIAQNVKPDFFQLHGKETPARAAESRSRFGAKVIKALTPDTMDAAASYDVDLLMFDTPAPQNAERPGGHGAAFDWAMLNGKKFARDWFLAGGLNPENVARAIAASGAAMVDVSSGVESAPGVKSPARIAEFVAAARQKVSA